MRNITEAKPETNYHVRNGLGYIRFAPHIEKVTQNGIIDSDEHITLLIRERQAEKRHQADIIEVA